MFIKMEANKNAPMGYYMCSQCGKSVKHNGGRLKRCISCKSPYLFYTENKEVDTSYNKFIEENKE